MEKLLLLFVPFFIFCKFCAICEEQVPKSIDDLEKLAIWSNPQEHSLQIKSFSNLEEALNYKYIIECEGYNPVQILLKKNNSYAVLLGKFPTYADCIWLRNELRKTRFEGCFIVSTGSRATNFIPEYLGPLPALFQTPVHGFSSDPAPDLARHNIFLEFQSDGKMTSGTLRQLVELDNALPSTDSLKSRILIELTRALILRDGDAESQLSRLKPIINGETLSAEEDFYEAILLKADVIHYFLKKRVESYGLYATLLKYSLPTGKKARCMAEICALTRELADCGAGTYADCLYWRERIHREIPGEYQNAHALADLICLENYLQEPNATNHQQDRIISLRKMLNQYLDRYQNSPRLEIFAISLYQSVSFSLDDPDGIYQAASWASHYIPLAHDELFYWEGKPRNIAVKIIYDALRYSQKKNDLIRIKDLQQIHDLGINNQGPLPLRIHVGESFEKAVGQTDIRF